MNNCKPDYSIHNWPIANVTVCRFSSKHYPKFDRKFALEVAGRIAAHQPTDNEGLKNWPYCEKQ